MTIRPSKIVDRKGITGTKNQYCFFVGFPELVTQMLMPGFRVGFCDRLIPKSSLVGIKDCF